MKYFFKECIYFFNVCKLSEKKTTHRKMFFSYLPRKFAQFTEEIVVPEIIKSLTHIIFVHNEQHWSKIGSMRPCISIANIRLRSSFATKTVNPFLTLRYKVNFLFFMQYSFENFLADM